LHRYCFIGSRAIAAGALVFLSAAQAAESVSVSDLKHLAIEDLMNVEVTSVSRRPERLSQAASAIQVISRLDIERSGATSVPEALRLASNLQVAQVNSSQWAISARGFNNVLANKLLVMIDGRTVYTPLYAGVFWDVQNVLLEDIDRIEVVSGPGGTLWGANAVNGVINVVTRGAKQSQGLFASAQYGEELHGGALRYGGELRPNLHYRVYARRLDREDTVELDGSAAGDAWHLTHGGFRIDWDGGAHAATLQGDLYDGRPNPDGLVAVTAKGGNVMGRWEYTSSEQLASTLQLYYDHTDRNFENGFAEEFDALDLDWQQQIGLGERHQIVWGLGARRMQHRTDNLALFAFQPARKTLDLYSVFIEDQIALVPERWRLTLGWKVEDHEYTGIEHQPNVRLAWTPNDAHTMWLAASRAARTPARIDRDFYLSIAPTIPFIAGSDMQAEQVVAYEAGWRVQPSSDLSVSTAVFFNEYDDLRSVSPGPPPFGIPVSFRNDVRGDSYGVELSMLYQVTPQWRLRGGYTFLRKDLEVKPGRIDLNDASAESNDPEHQIVAQSMFDVTDRIRLDGVIRYVDALSDPQVPSYVGVDLRLAWQATSTIELALTGQNLLDSHHLEFIPDSPSAREIERSVYARISWRN
jgi:iron complex outermembrane receptor protein